MKWLRVLHLITVSIWFGSVVCIFTLALICFFQLNEASFLAVAPLVPVLYKSLVLPVGLLTLIQGLVYGACTNWGFFKYRWIIFKWCLVILTTLCTGLGGIGQIFTVLERLRSVGYVGGWTDGGQFLFYVSLQILFMTIMILLSVFKPGKIGKVSQ